LDVSVTTLDSGLRVVTHTMPHLETASVGVWVGAGARNEDVAANGISHMLEHMAFKGTESRSARDIAECIEAVGGYLNAYTSREQTAYFARVLKDDVPLAVDLLGDILLRSVFDPAELEREREVIIQEIGQTNDTPDDIIFDNLQMAAFPEQAIGRSILGTIERVRGFGRDDLAGYMAKHYTGGTMVLAAAGGVDHDTVVKLAEQAFAGIRHGTNGKLEPARYAGGPSLDSRKLEQVHFTLGFRSVPYHDPGYYPSQVMAMVLGGGMSSRLFQEVRENRGLAYSVYAFAGSYMDDGLFTVYAGTGEDEVDEMVPVICDEILKVADKVDEVEVARARAQLKASVLMTLESSSSRCEQLGRQMHVYGRPLTTEEIIEAIDAVDTKAVSRAARDMIGAAPPTLAAIGPIARLENYERIAARFA
jgi:predicted Zn-dependent peptidase